MTEPKFTPAPWVLSGRQVYSGKLDDDNFMDSIFVASVSDRNKNDSHLIAAAPDLYEALVACHEAMEYMSEYDIPITLPQQVKDALAKARGE